MGTLVLHCTCMHTDVPEIHTATCGGEGVSEWGSGKAAALVSVSVASAISTSSENCSITGESNRWRNSGYNRQCMSEWVSEWVSCWVSVTGEEWKMLGVSSQPGVRCPVWGVRCEVSDVRCKMSGVRCEMWGVRCEVWGVRCEVWGVRCEVWGVRCEASGVRCEVWGVRCEVWGVRCQMWGVRCEVWGVRCK